MGSLELWLLRILCLEILTICFLALQCDCNLASILTRASHEETALHELIRKIDITTDGYSKPYYDKALKRLIETNPENCDIDLEDSTKEDKIKVPIWLSFFLGYKPFHNIMKEK